MCLQVSGVFGNIESRENRGVRNRGVRNENLSMEEHLL